MEADTRIIEKIKKLLAFAGDHRGNPNEIARAAAQAEAMLRKYNLEMTDVIMAELKDNEDAVTTADVFLRYRRGKRYTKIPTWAQWLAVAISELFDCHCKINFSFNTNDRVEAVLRFFGYHTDLTICTWMIDYVCAEVYRAARNADIQGTKAADSFRRGASRVICQRLRELKSQKDNEYRSSSTGTALVVYKRAKVEEKFGEFSYSSKEDKATIDHAAYMAGVAAGSKINLNPGKPIDAPADAPRLSS